ncbi:hypothetical protein SELMODRAFT_428063 [Selaginella moellendorffii]|uniref:Tify domain-containing protein n=1 Tax=Selaginella moellendorffii TaxID=88036 RepID=D8T1K8_SELML|nr:protein TIFY 4B isoform X1 [Selaginella moellendorffii]EFJ09350.1 hypothetical protein SELMODRAFT_428063 [Selaginella moellendorffii]|eukprot:XP_002989474.1 protein TIFY 4B isoform X1 [Selaginella moellendorffii]
MAASILGCGSSNGVAVTGNPAPAAAAEVPAPLRPLEELTELDIRQLTREDCRRYLKERGMRRPSWNKAQAIQQVLSLRSLLCPSNPVGPSSKNPGSAANAPPAEAAAAGHTKQLLDKVSQQSMPDSCPSNNASDPRPLAGCFGSLAPTLSVLNPDAKRNPLSSKPASTTKPHSAQLTIFYSGIVNVYDDVPLDKAQAIMLLAASKTFHVPTSSVPGHPPFTRATQQQQQQRELNQQTEATLKYPMQHQQAPQIYLSSASALPDESCTEPGLPQVRSASLQRFLAKRRDRLSGNPSSSRRNDRSKKRRFSPPPPPLTSALFQFPSSARTSQVLRYSTTSTTTITTATATAATTTGATNGGQCSNSNQASENASSDTSGGSSGTPDTSDTTRDNDNGRVSKENGRVSTTCLAAT